MMQASKEKKQTKGRVLIVDDDPLVMDALVDIVKSLDTHVMSATNGLEALEIIRAQPIDLVISDIKMPKMDGIQFITQLRKEHYSTLVTFVTGYGDKEMIRQAWKHGAYDFIDKPFDVNQLRSIVKSALVYGQTYFSSEFIKSDSKKELKLHLSQKIAADLGKHCESKKLNTDALIESLIANYLMNERV